METQVAQTQGPYWIDGPHGCPIGGPFDLWRRDHFRSHDVPPADTAKMYPSLGAQVVIDIAVAVVLDSISVDDLLVNFADLGPAIELTLAHNYFNQWRRRAPFMPDSMQDVPLL